MQLSKGQNTHQAVSAHEACNIKIINNKQNNYCQLIKKKQATTKAKVIFQNIFWLKHNLISLMALYIEIYLPLKLFGINKLQTKLHPTEKRVSQSN